MPRQRLRLRDILRTVHCGWHHVSGGSRSSAIPHHRNARGPDLGSVPGRYRTAALGRGDARQGVAGLNLSTLFDLSLIGRRDTVGLEFEGETYTFGEIDARSNRLAQLLLRRGLKTGDRLCVYLTNCVGMIDLYLACVHLGVIFVPINILYRDREITHILNDAEPAAVVSDSDFSSAVPI